MNKETKHDKALRVFVERHKRNKNVLAILVSGSYIHSKPDKNSDLDVYVVLEKSKMRERGNTWINGVEIEYFINPVKQVRYYFRTEVGEKAPCTAHMFANSIILYQKNSIVNKLISEAKSLIKRKMAKMNKMELEFARYEIDDSRKDLEDVFLKKDAFAFSVIANDLLSKCLNTFFRVQRVPQEKSKRLKIQLKQMDPKFEGFYVKAIQAKDMSLKYKSINKVVDYIENLIGGKRPKEWKIRSKNTAI